MSSGATLAMVDPEKRRRRNVRLAIVHALLALGFLAAFVWAQVHR